MNLFENIERLASSRTDAHLHVGSRFTLADARSYKVNGERHMHTITTLCEMTAVTDAGFEYVVVEVLEERNRPPFVTGGPQGGSMAWFGWDGAVARGDVKVVS